MAELHTDQEYPLNKELNLPFKSKEMPKKVFRDWGSLKAYIIDGKLARETLDLDFTEGGNYGKYDFVPKDEIWLDDGQREDELFATLLHEMIEYADIIKGASYDQGHRLASEVELRTRLKPEEFPSKIDEQAATLKKLLGLEK
jgi:hypothetical protein